MSYISFWHVPSIYWYVSYISNFLKLLFWLSYSVKSLDMCGCASRYPNSPHFILPHGLPWWLSGKESACQCRRCKFNPWVRKIPWRRKWQPTPVVLLGKSRGQRSLAGYRQWGCKRVRYNLVTKQTTVLPYNFWMGTS